MFCCHSQTIFIEGSGGKSSYELKEMPASQYRYLLRNQDNVLDEMTRATVNQLASNILQQYNDTVKTVIQEQSTDSQQIKDRFAQTYGNIKEQIMTAQLSTVAKDELAATLWQKQHTDGAETSCRRKCLDICRHHDLIELKKAKKNLFKSDRHGNQIVYMQNPGDGNFYRGFRGLRNKGRVLK